MPDFHQPLDEACAVQDDAVATVLDFDGMTVDCDPEPPLDELELDDSVHGGTISIVRPLFCGTTSWFCSLLELLPLELLLDPPPGVSSTVLDGGGVLDPLLELELELELG